MSKFVLPKKYINFCKKNAIADKSKYDSNLYEKHHILPKQNWQRPEYKAKMKAALKACWKRKHREQEQLKKGGPYAE